MTETRPHVPVALHSALSRPPASAIRRRHLIEGINQDLFEARIISMRTEDPEMDAAADAHAGPFVGIRFGVLDCPTRGQEKPIIIPEISLYHHYTRINVGEVPGTVRIRFETIRRDYRGREPRLELELRLKQ